MNGNRGAESNSLPRNMGRPTSGMARLVAAVTAFPLVLGLMAGCTPSDTGKIIEEVPLAPVTLNEAESIRLANALSWKQKISGDEARAIIDKVYSRASRDTSRDIDKDLAPYRKIEREHARFLRQERLDSLGGEAGEGGGDGH